MQCSRAILVIAHHIVCTTAEFCDCENCNECEDNLCRKNNYNIHSAMCIDILLSLRQPLSAEAKAAAGH